MSPAPVRSAVTLTTTAPVAAPAQAGGVTTLLFLLLVVLGVVAVVGGVLWGLTALTERLFGTSRQAGREFQRGLTGASEGDGLTDHPAIEATGRYGEGTPEVETTVDGRRVVGRLETAPGGTDRYAVLQTAMLSVRAGTGFELSSDDRGRVEFVDREADTPELPEAVWATLEDLDVVGGITVDDRTGVVEHRFPDPDAVGDAGTFLRQAEALVAVAEAVEDHAEAGAGGRRGSESGRETELAGEPAVETDR